MTDEPLKLSPALVVPRNVGAASVCSTRDFIRISKEELPTGVVKARFLKLTREHIEYVMDCVSRNTTQIGNIKAYLLAALYNAPVTIGQYYTALVSHDMAQGFDGG